MLNDQFEKYCAGLEANEKTHLLRACDLVSKTPPLKKHGIRGVDVASILLDLNADFETILTAILSDPPLRDKITHDELVRDFGATVAGLVKDTHWLNTLRIYSSDLISQPRQAETLRRMLLSMTHDVRSVLVKLAYRVQRLRLLSHEDYDIRNFIARETLDVYAPIANRLGIGQLKWELEDMAFRYVHPQIYRKIAKGLADKRQEREACIGEFISEIKKILGGEGVQGAIFGRPKHIYSIWKKMQKKQIDLSELYDLLAIRIIVDKVSTCYTVLGLVHGHWRNIPKEFDDYIAHPKENGYQSLHTVVWFDDAHRIEIQIRTREMDEFAELGVAAHWRYKEGGKYEQATQNCINSLRQLLESKHHTDKQLLDNLRGKLYSDRVYVLTPAGALVDLPKGSTPLDFAYSVHTDVGHRCQGAKVNGRIAQLTAILNSGDTVEILTGKKSEPKKNWLDPHMGYLKSPRAIAKVKAWFKKQQYDKHLLDGKTLLDKEMQKLGLPKTEAGKLAVRFKYADLEKFYVAVGSGLINMRQIAGAVAPAGQPAASPKSAPRQKQSGSIVTVQGVDNVMTKFARCCHPIPGDKIIGFISKRSGITIHKKDCATIRQFNEEQIQRLLEADWSTEESTVAVNILIKAYDRQGLLNDITEILNEENINITGADFSSERDLTAQLRLSIQIRTDFKLEPVLNKIRQLANIHEIKRMPKT